MKTVKQTENAIQAVINGAATQYIYASGKTIRVSNHGANPSRTDDNTISIVIDNNVQSYRADRGRMITNWERSNQFYMINEGVFTEQFESVESFLNWFDIE